MARRHIGPPGSRLPAALKRIGPRFALVPATALLLVACAGPRPTASSTPEPSPIESASPTPATSPTAAEPTPSPEPTELPLSTVAPIPSSGIFGAGLLYGCDGGGLPAFPIELLETPPSSELNPDPTPILIAWPVPTTAIGWWLIARTQTRADYVGRDAEGRFYESAILERDKDGVWKAAGWGGCSFYARVPGVEGADVLGWWIRERDWPQPGDRTLHIRVRTWCPQTLPERMLEPIVRYAPDRIIAIVGARPLTQEPRTCGETQIADATIELDEPVGDRLILDAREWPGRDAHIRTEEMLLCCG